MNSSSLVMLWRAHVPSSLSIKHLIVPLIIDSWKNFSFKYHISKCYQRQILCLDLLFSLCCDSFSYSNELVECLGWCLSHWWIFFFNVIRSSEHQKVILKANHSLTMYLLSSLLITKFGFVIIRYSSFESNQYFVLFCFVLKNCDAL
jgi:hypothetical protein